MAVVPVAVSAGLWFSGQRIFAVRNVMEAGPFAAVCIATVVARLPRYVGPLTAVALITLIAIDHAAGSDHMPGRPADRVAAVLRAEGWTPGDPILVPGVNWVVPLGWYLHGYQRPVKHPPSVRRCRRVFLIINTRERRARAVLGQNARNHGRTVGPFLVVRLGGNKPVPSLPPNEHLVNTPCSIATLSQGPVGS